MNPVNRAFDEAGQPERQVRRLGRSRARRIGGDAVHRAAADWTTAATGAQILKDVLMAKANILALNQGYDPDVVVVDDLNYASAAARSPPPATSPARTTRQPGRLTGAFMQVGGLLWLPTPNVPTANGVRARQQQLGGMADENLGGPGYVRSAGDAPGVESKTIRDDTTTSGSSASAASPCPSSSSRPPAGRSPRSEQRSGHDD
jgi:hypothetical protein